MGNALETLRRMQRQRRRPTAWPRAAQEPPPLPVVEVEPSAGDAGPQNATSGRERLVFRGPLDETAELTPAERFALEAVGLVVRLADGREVVAGLATGTVLSWPLGVTDENGRPLPYLRNGAPVVPFVADDVWKWWRGGLPLDDVAAQLVEAEAAAPRGETP